MENLEFRLEPLGQPLRDIPLRCVPWRGVNADEHGAILDRYFPDGGAQEFLPGRLLNSFAIPPKGDVGPQSRDNVAGTEDGALWITPPPPWGATHAPWAFEGAIAAVWAMIIPGIWKGCKSLRRRAANTGETQPPSLTPASPPMPWGFVPQQQPPKSPVILTPTDADGRNSTRTGRRWRRLLCGRSSGVNTTHWKTSL
ncbi:DUF368 domain-containing protein [Sinorhizobium fredii]|uniref:DUF368 domain-containing protein n=1 Tax=Rhizobium fredii TaxID=380 RepID=UPI00117D77E0|nr:DUF368 domain-containing protein [Sinorhizobium fredii]